MVHKMNEPMSRRQFLRVAGTGVLTLGLTSPFLFGCGPKDVEKVIVGLTKLATLINNYRQQNGLAAIPISSKMTAVALKHVIDLSTYHPEKNCNSNTHSWSKHGKWKGGCYKPNDKSTWTIMLDKPKEIAGYKWKGENTCYMQGHGYEIAAGPGLSSAQAALNQWKNSKLHDDVILNKGTWACATWRALGAGYAGGYACAWFGESQD